jgi:hypothetical protein
MYLFVVESEDCWNEYCSRGGKTTTIYGLFDTQ